MISSEPEQEPRIYSRSDHSISRRDIDPDAIKIMYRLIHHGFKAFLVGGGVRDLLLNKKPKDFDISTDATPRQIKSIFRNSRIIGRRFKLAHIFFHGGKIIEVSTFRDFTAPIDPEDEQENPSQQFVGDNKFGTERTDALRRDITINGLFYDLSTFSIIDYVGGMDDLNNKVIRVIGEPDVRFHEDPVRMIRVIRHAARSGFEIEENCKKAIQHHHSLLLTSSNVRVYEELKKDFSSGFALQILQLLAKHELLKLLVPELTQDDSALLDNRHAFARLLGNLDELRRDGEPVSATVVLSLIALFTGDTSLSEASMLTRFETKQELVEHLKGCFSKLSVPRKERERIEELLLLWHMVMHTPVEKIKVNAIARRSAAPDLRILLLALGDSEAVNARRDLFQELPERQDDDQRHGRQRRRKPRGPFRRQMNRARHHGS